MKSLMMAAAASLGLTAAVAQDDLDSHAISTAIGGYPACSAIAPDSCVQTGAAKGLADVGMPIEPVERHALAANDPMDGYRGMGGPAEEEEYPPCDPGPGDDNCIQLYERGVAR